MLPRFSLRRLGHGVMAVMVVVNALVLQASVAGAISGRTIFTASGPVSGDQFARSVASAGDFNGDGRPDVIVGAPLNDGGGGSSGRAYIYFGGNLEAAPLLLTGIASEQLGFAVASAGDVNADGYGDVIVGCPTNAAGNGRALLYFGGPIPNGTADLILPNRFAGEQFGYSVAGAGDMNGDGYDDLIVGAPFNDSTAVDIGRAYIYYGGLAPDPIPDIALIGGAAGDQLGLSVASARDWNGDGYGDVIVGVPFNDVTALDAGAAYVYYGGAAPNNAADVALAGLVTLDHFGASVASVGDMNGDGNPDVAVGAPDNDATGNASGSAYVFLGGASASPTADLTLAGVDANDFFGRSVAAAGDVNGDGYADLIVGANGAGAPSNNDGLVYVYLGGGSLNGVADLVLGPPPTGDVFGSAVATAGDIDGDGYEDVLVGDYLDATSGTNGGRLYVTTIFPYQLVAPNGGETWAVGAPVTVRWRGHDPADIELSVDGGLTYTVVQRSLGGQDENEFTLACLDAPTTSANVRVRFTGLTATRANSDASDRNFRIVKVRPGAPMALKLGRVIPGEALGDTVGRSLAAGDFNGDGVTDVLFGAPGNDAAGVNAGRAYMMPDPIDGRDPCEIYPPPLCWLMMTGAAPGDGFGFSVGAIGDLNGDGYQDWAVGAPRADAAPFANVGKVYVFYGGSTLDNAPDLTLGGEMPEDQFGYALAGAGDFNQDGYDDLAVGAPFAHFNGTLSGRVYVYYGGSSPDNLPDWHIDGPAPSVNFGQALAGRIRLGDLTCPPIICDPPPWLLMIGAPFSDAVAANAGAVYGFAGGRVPDALPDMVLLGDQADAHFGSTIARVEDFNGDRIDDIAIGSPDYNGAGADAGRVNLVALDPTGYPAPDQPCGAVPPFWRDPCCPTCGPDWFFDGEFGGDRFGASLTSTDMNADGLGDLVVGAPGADASVALATLPGMESAPGGPHADLSLPDGGRLYFYLGSIIPRPLPTTGSSIRQADMVINGTSAGRHLGSALAAQPQPEPPFGDPDPSPVDPDPQPAEPEPEPYLGHDIFSALEDTAVVRYDVNRFHLLDDFAGLEWQVGSMQKVSWFGNSGARLDLSVDGGASWTSLATVPATTGRDGAGPTGARHRHSVRVPHLPTRFAKLRLSPWPPCPPCPACLTCPPMVGFDVSDTMFTIRSSIALLSLVAKSGEEGATLSWSTDAKVAPDGIAGYRLYRVPPDHTGDGARIGPELITETRFTDRDAVPGSTYRLAAVNGVQEEIELGRVTLDGRISGLLVSPSPVKVRGTLSLTFAAPMAGESMAATDLDVGVFDVIGRRVATVAHGYVRPEAGQVRLSWNTSGGGGAVAPGLYFIRAIAPSAGLRLERKFVVLP